MARNETLRLAAVVAAVVGAFFAAYSYALGSTAPIGTGSSVVGQQGGAGAYGQAAAPGYADAAAQGGPAAGGLPGGGCCGGGAASQPGAAAGAAGGGGCCGGGPQKEIRKTARQVGDTQVIKLTVNGAYDPNVIVVKAGVPLRIDVDHRSSGGCDQTIVFPDFGVSRDLPPNGKESITLGPAKPGTYRFTCGMGMLSGTLVVQ